MQVHGLSHDRKRREAPSRPPHSRFSLCLSPQSCQADLVKDNGHKYFLSVLADPYMPVRTRHHPPWAVSGSLSFVSAHT